MNILRITFRLLANHHENLRKALSMTSNISTSPWKAPNDSNANPEHVKLAPAAHSPAVEAGRKPVETLFAQVVAGMREHRCSPKHPRETLQ
jgi:hypothetical protein